QSSVLARSCSVLHKHGCLIGILPAARTDTCVRRTTNERFHETGQFKQGLRSEAKASDRLGIIRTGIRPTQGNANPTAIGQTHDNMRRPGFQLPANDLQVQVSGRMPPYCKPDGFLSSSVLKLIFVRSLSRACRKPPFSTRHSSSTSTVTSAPMRSASNSAQDRCAALCLRVSSSFLPAVVSREGKQQHTTNSRYYRPCDWR